MKTRYKPARLVQQQGERDCFIACLAMAEGVVYQEIASRLNPKDLAKIQENGLYGDDIHKTLRAVGWMERYHYFKTIGFTGTQTWLLNHYLFERPAFLQVPSLNFEDDSHIVYWDGRQMLDPSKDKKYTEESLFQYGADHVWLINPDVSILE